MSWLKGLNATLPLMRRRLLLRRDRRRHRAADSSVYARRLPAQPRAVMNFYAGMAGGNQDESPVNFSVTFVD